MSDIWSSYNRESGSAFEGAPDNNNFSSEENSYAFTEKELQNGERELQQEIGQRAIEFAKGEAEKQTFEATSRDDDPYSDLLVFDENDKGNFIDKTSIKETKIEINERAEQAKEKMREFCMKNFEKVADTYKGLKREELGLELALEITKVRNGNDRNAATDKILEKVDGLKKQIDTLKETPEGAYLVYGLKLKEDIRSLENHQVLKTPYVESFCESVKENIAIGRHTFIDGPTGSGKTELARTVAREAAIHQAALKAAAEDVKAMGIDSAEKSRIELAKSYEKYERHFKSQLARGEEEAKERFEPLIISASKDMSTKELFVENTLEVDSANKKSITESNKELEEELTKYKSEHSEEWDKMSKDERRQAENRILQLYMQKNQAFGTVVKHVEKEVARAVKEGRPVIIDEANTIQAGVMIALNDLLNSKPGDTCYVPGLGQTKIEKGFAIIMTANISDSHTEYAGTNKMNIANMDRLSKKSYGYLPQSIVARAGDALDGELMKENVDEELFKVLMMKLVDKHGNLALPESEKNIKKIFQLAQFAKHVQKLFSGERESELYVNDASGDSQEVDLSETVLSVRGLLMVLDIWNRGEKMSLDEALWNSYIGGVQDSNEQQSLIKIARQYNFFPDSGGWNMDILDKGVRRKIELADVLEENYNYKQTPLEYRTSIDVIKMLYGEIPPRTEYPLEDVSADELADLALDFDNMTNAERVQYWKEVNKKKEEIHDTIDALEVLAEECGCNVETNEVA